MSKHAIEQAKNRVVACNTDEDATEFILSVARFGVPWQAPAGPAVRHGLYVVGYEKVRKGVVITTIYELTFGHAVRDYYQQVVGHNREKPGRKKAWKRLRHQKKYCKYPPVIPTR